MIGRIFGGLQRWLGRTANVKISNYREFNNLVAHSNAIKAELAAAKQQLEHARTQEQMHRARAQWLAVYYQQFMASQVRSLGALVASAVKNAAERPSPVAGARDKTAVIVMTSPAQITQLKALIGSVAFRNSYRPVVVGYLDAKKSGVLDVCKENAITLLSHRFETVVGDPMVNQDEPQGSLITVSLEATLAAASCTAEEQAAMRGIAGLAEEVRRQKAIATGVQRILRHVEAAVVIMFEDNAEYDTGIWASVAEQLLIPTVILPYTIADQLEPAEAHHHDQIFWAEQGTYNRLAKAALPHWLYHYRDRWLLRRAGLPIVAAEALGFAPPAPWILNSSKAEAIGVESEAMRKHYVTQGIPDAQLALTGSLADDLLYQARNEQDTLRKSLGLAPDRPVLLCSIPPNQLTATRPECEFADFHKLVDFWLGELLKLEGWQVLIKPHPALQPGDLEYLKRDGMRVLTDVDTTSLIPLCDIYNPSVSSTIRWALACGKPVLNYDVYRYRYQDFTAEDAVINVVRADEFSSALQRLTGNRVALDEATALAKEAAARWGMLDGRSMERIVGLLDDVAARRRMVQPGL